MEIQEKTLLMLPAYNEEKNIKGVLDSIKSLGLNIDCLVVDDGSCDKTYEITREYGHKAIRHPFNMGYGVALHTGFKYAAREGYEQVITMDADGQHDISSIFNLIKHRKETNADVVIGSRFLSPSGYQFSPMKNLARLFLIFLIFLIVHKKFSDPTSGFQLLNRRAFSFLAGIDFPEDYPDADIIILMALNDFKVEEIGAKMIYRKYGRSIHGGLKPVYYGYKIIISILSILVNQKLTAQNNNNLRK